MLISGKAAREKMIRPVITLRRKQVIVDVDTQRDLFFADGKACVLNHRQILANIRRVMAWARLKNIRVISTVRSHVSNGKLGECCISGTDGQRKIGYTIRNKRILFDADGCTDLHRDILRQYDQIILQKRCIDPFDEPKADRVLSELRVSDFILIGAVTEDAVKATALGLLTRKKNVTIMTDAIGCRDKKAAEVAIRQMEAKGATLIESRSVLGTGHLNIVGACGCPRCSQKLRDQAISLRT